MINRKNNFVSVPTNITIVTPMVKPEVSSDVLTSIDSQRLEDTTIYVHAHVNNADGMFIRVWRSTYLVDRISGARAALLHAENISFAPQWTMITNSPRFSFLMIFASLPSNCKVFDLVEDIPQANGFYVPAIQRNRQDVYHVDVL